MPYSVYEPVREYDDFSCDIVQVFIFFEVYKYVILYYRLLLKLSCWRTLCILYLSYSLVILRK